MSLDPIPMSNVRRKSTSAPDRSGMPFAALLGFLSMDRMLLTGLCAISIGFFSVAYTISLQDPDYFDRRLLSTMRSTEIDPITTGAVAGGGTEGDEAIPVPRIVRAKAPVAGDYQIVMVFENEAILATTEELWRVKVGSVVPGLGEVLEIDPTETGGTIKASEATLRSVAR